MNELPPHGQRRFSSRFSLLTLLILGGILPPVLAIGWFLAIIASHYVRDAVLSLIWPTLLAAFGLSIYALVAPPPKEGKAESLPLFPLIALGCCQFLALWTWNYTICYLAGWVMIWGDNTEPSHFYLLLVSAIFSALIACVSSLRIKLKLASRWYIRVNVWATVALAIVSVLVWLHEVTR